MKKILITGAYGQLGTALREHSKEFEGLDFLFTDVQSDDEIMPLDLTDKMSLTTFINTHTPDWVINCAAYTRVDQAEEDPEGAYRLNADVLKNLLDTASGHSFRLIHISTDYVFNGRAYRPYREEDNPDPQSVYGKSKYEGEQIVLGYPQSMIIRTSWLYSEMGSNFVKTILRLATEKNTLDVVYDQIGTPTYAGDLATVILQVIQNIEENTRDFQTGIYHFSNEGVCSWYDFALEIVKFLKMKTKIRPVTSKHFVRPARRPFYSVLAKEKIKENYGVLIPYWKDSLYKCLNNLKSKNNGR
ncbi:MAG TPA: dTDP-4-dehydrorhamnose reductase [Bacteroidetes bacterium]|nr:dTDP-4-dehydrorhamnose reductase [Bacteroidota bacterium]